MESPVDLFKNEMGCGSYHISKVEKYLEKYSRVEQSFSLLPKHHSLAQWTEQVGHTTPVETI